MGLKLARIDLHRFTRTQAYAHQHTHTHDMIEFMYLYNKYVLQMNHRYDIESRSSASLCHSFFTYTHKVYSTIDVDN